MKRFGFIALVIFATLIVEALLAGRIWAQVTAQSTNEGELKSLFAVTYDLAWPFQLITGDAPLREPSVIDFTILVAIEGYFILMLALLALIYFAGRAGALLGIFRSKHRAAEAAALVARFEPEAPRLWQPLSSKGETFYITVKPRPERPAHTKAGLGLRQEPLD
jgi:hypothetical protein